MNIPLLFFLLISSTKTCHEIETKKKRHRAILTRRSFKTWLISDSINLVFHTQLSIALLILRNVNIRHLVSEWVSGGSEVKCWNISWSDDDFTEKNENFKQKNNGEKYFKSSFDYQILTPSIINHHFLFILLCALNIFDRGFLFPSHFLFPLSCFFLTLLDRDLYPFTMCCSTFWASTYS